jgi:23S rRNA (pseudouridine1915-N3)-methyltransferase
VAREILIVRVGRHQRGTWEELCSEYRQRIQPQFSIRELLVRLPGGPPKEGPDASRERLRREGVALLAALPDPCYLVTLDRRGRSLSSQEFAALLARVKVEFPHPIAFLIGSDLGLDPAATAAARLRWSLGPLTLAHELARLVLYEQLYRAIAIEAGIPYHRQPL